MDLYQYIAENQKSQQAAINLCKQYGGDPVNDTDLAEQLSQLVDLNGDEGLKAVMDIHPDKPVILHYYSVPPSQDTQRIANMKIYANSTGNTPSSTSTTTTDNTNNTPTSGITNIGNNVALQTNIIIFAAAVLIGFAIISKN